MAPRATGSCPAPEPPSFGRPADPSPRRIGTFIGHKGAVWQARMAPDSSTAATASADFFANIWDTHTGELLYRLKHDHIVRAVAYAPDNADLVATGGMEKKLRIFDLAEMKPQSNGTNDGEATIHASSAFEIGEGVHTASIKFIVWTRNPNILVTASGNTLRWFDLPSRSAVKTEVLDGEIGSCEFNMPATDYVEKSDLGGGLPVLTVAAGKCVYFWGGLNASDELKRVQLNYKVSSVALDTKNRKYVVGEDIPATWARVYNWDDDKEIGTTWMS
jgi:serine-threonine kinase receptor-associated protein